MTAQGDKTRARLAKRYPKVASPAPEVVVADGRAWVKVDSARPWRPRQVGEALVGEYIGRSTRPGDNGTVYGVVTVRTNEGAFTISGVVITGLFEAASPLPEATVRIVYLGERISGTNRVYKDYDLYLAKDEVRQDRG